MSSDDRWLRDTTAARDATMPGKDTTLQHAQFEASLWHGQNVRARACARTRTADVQSKP